VQRRLDDFRKAIFVSESHRIDGQQFLNNAIADRRRAAAVDDVVADVLALDEVDDVFGDVGGVVADALEVLGDRMSSKAGNTTLESPIM